MTPEKKEIDQSKRAANNEEPLGQFKANTLFNAELLVASKDGRRIYSLGGLPLRKERQQSMTPEKKERPKKSRASYQDSSAYRLPPQDPDAERALLSSMLLQTDLIEEVQAKIDPDAFHIPAHGIIFAMVCAMKRLKIAVDIITLTSHLGNEGTLDAIGGAAYVCELLSFVPTAANWEFYLNIILEKHILRSIIATCTHAIGRAYEEQDDVQSVLDTLQSEAIAIGQIKAAQETLVQIGPEVFTVLENIEKQYDNRGKCTGLSTGFVDLDRMTDGLQPGYVYYIGARPAMGKSALAMNMAEHIALNILQEGIGVAVFSVEMTRNQLVKRLVCSRAEVNLQRLRDGYLAESDFPRLTAAGAALRDSKIYVNDKGDLSINEFRSLARRAISKFKCKVIVIDYIQRMRSTSKRAQGNREQEINEIAQGISATAKELQVPIIVLAQLSRNPEKRKDARPELADLRESGSMEQEAHFVGLLYRPEYYAKTEEEKEALAGKATLIIAKQREGPVGDIDLNFRKEFTRFKSTTTKLYSNDEEERQH